ncbi:unnamed protein product [Sympodiomycopsis kandeliae]
MASMQRRTASRSRSRTQEVESIASGRRASLIHDPDDSSRDDASFQSFDQSTSGLADAPVRQSTPPPPQLARLSTTAGPPPALSPSHPRPTVIASTRSSRPMTPVRSRTRPNDNSAAGQASPISQLVAGSSTSNAVRARSPASSHTESETEDEGPIPPSNSSRITIVVPSPPMPPIPARQSPMQQQQQRRSDQQTSSPVAQRNRATAAGTAPADHSAIVISSSGESDGESDAEETTGHRRARRRISEGDSSFVIERVVRRPTTRRRRRTSQTIDLAQEILDDSVQDAFVDEADDEIESRDDAIPRSRRTLQASPPRTKPPPLSYPLVSTFTCPICFCAPTDTVTTPCGHVFCSECLFEALKVPATQRVQSLQSRAALQAGQQPSWLRSFSNGRGGGGGRGGASMRGRGGSTTARETRSSAAAAQEDAVSEETTDYSKYDALEGPCPNCRAMIPGGFISKGILSTSSTRPAKKRAVFGLIFKTGKPIDDPRRDER